MSFSGFATSNFGWLVCFLQLACFCLLALVSKECRDGIPSTSSDVLFCLQSFSSEREGTERKKKKNRYEAVRSPFMT